MPAFRLAIPFILLLGLGIYLTIEVDTSWSLLMIAMVVILVSFYVLAPQINWWWWQRSPPDLPTEMAQFLSEKSPFYQQLSEQEQREFRRRVFLFNEGSDYKPQVLESIPLDVKVIIASVPVTMTFGQEEFLFTNFENIIIYPHPFPSPQYQEHFHISEIYEPDGVVMFCLEHVLRGFVDAKQYLNPAWYEYARIFQNTYPAYDYGDWSSVSWEDLQGISGFSQEALERWIGLPELDLTAMGIAFYFIYPQQFKQKLPELDRALNLVFKTSVV
ncbi:MAG: zinc-dependent peptidase [Lewinella sp.]|jgi:hypothetical protein|uniref:zinc-dependent peptidase n=1 Tax=Lewinella sp. TaxID=2004506 RepID=UPI003D6C0F0F